MAQPDKHLGSVKGPDGRDYRLNFIGDNGGAAVISGPAPLIAQPGRGAKMESLPVVHREPAENADDAREKLTAWLQERGWPTTF